MCEVLLLMKSHIDYYQVQLCNQFCVWAMCVQPCVKKVCGVCKSCFDSMETRFYESQMI